MADAVEAFGQDVGEESAGEIVGGEGHRLPPGGAVHAVILPAEGDAAWPRVASRQTKLDRASIATGETEPDVTSTTGAVIAMPPGQGGEPLHTRRRRLAGLTRFAPVLPQLLICP